MIYKMRIWNSLYRVINESPDGYFDDLSIRGGPEERVEWL